MINIKKISKWACLLVCLQAAHLYGAEEINLTAEGVAVLGYDPVAYFESSEPVMGRQQFQLNHDGAIYHFSSAANLQRFTENPEKYTPAYGGYCSFGVRHGQKLNIDPDAWAIVNDVLYLQLDLGTQKVWNEEREKNIEIADRIWAQIQSLPADAIEVSD